MDSALTNSLYLDALECNGQPGSRCSEPPAPKEGASLTTSENDRAPTFAPR
jgi:hypothetical protein